MAFANSPQIILASTSPFRKQLLGKTGLDFITAAPEVDETPYPGEQAAELVERLALAKANAIARHNPKAIVIGSDQVALNGDKILGKPGDHPTAVRQLTEAAGQFVTFYTGLAVVQGDGLPAQCCVETYAVKFRQLSTAEIEGYLLKERPYNCAGSFKSEALGITLFERFEGRDPNTLIGLPLIQLLEFLRARGINPLL